MYIAVDNGGTATRVGIMRDLHVAEIEIIERFPTEQSYQKQISRLVQIIQNISERSIQGIGVSFGAQIAKDGLYVLDAVNLRDYEGQPMVRQLSDEFSCAVRLAHDAVCGILAEKAFGALGPFDQCAYLTVSTGTGAAIQTMKQGIALTFSIEMGHQILTGNSRECLCGQIGCLETITGGKQIALRFGREAAEIQDPSFWQEFTDNLAVGIVNLSWLTRVEAVAISGGIALNSSYVREHLSERVNALRVGEICQLFWSHLGENAPLIGSALLLETSEMTILH